MYVSVYRLMKYRPGAMCTGENNIATMCVRGIYLRLRHTVENADTSGTKLKCPDYNVKASLKITSVCEK